MENTSEEQKTIELYGASIHKINIKSTDIPERFVDITKNDLKNYLTGIIRDILKNSRSQKFKLGDESSKVPQLISLLTNSKFSETSTILAKRLHRVESQVQERYKGLTELRGGSLLCAHIRIESQQFALLVKIDHADFFDETELNRTTGLPEKQRAQKAATFEIVDSEPDTVVIISDSSNSITEYWWKDFLELLPLSTPEKNTEKAFKALETLLIRKIKDKSPSDYWSLRNAVVSHFNTRTECIYDEMIDQLFDGYKPDHPDIEIGKIKEEAKKLPSIKEFDTHFIIIKSIIKAKIKKKIRLAENLELQIKGEIDDFNNTFATGEDGNGKFLKIYSKDGYEAFHKPEEPKA
jgi:hypothetical protein